MSLTSTYFLIFLIVLVPVYYAVPKKLQWWVLLAASTVFYLFSGWTNIFYVLFTSLTSWGATYILQKKSDEQKQYIKENKETLSKEDKKAYKEKIKSKRKAIMLIAVILNIGLLVFFKILTPVNNILESKNLDTWNIIVPLGISYYTLQTVGYIVDVYWNNVKAEKNYFKVLLFTSFFPQMTQGPISDFKQLSDELFTEHIFTYKNYSWGFQRMLWGFFKKLVIADLMQLYIKELLDNYKNYELAGISLIIGMFMIMIQLYADFSGYMDIVCGICEMLGIKLAENFNRPFFSKSLSEFWRRWHITLGLWFKKYVFFPVGTSKFANCISKKVKSKFGSTAGEKTVSTIALLAIWFSIGAWHSINLPFVLWGILNGLIMIFSLWMEPVYAKTRNLLHIKENSKLLKIFRIIRTFTLVSVLEAFSDIGTLSDFFEYSKTIFSNILIIPNSISKIFPFFYVYFDINTYIIVIIFIIFIIIDIFNIKIQNEFNKLPTVFRAIILAILCCLIFAMGANGFNSNTEGFLYANF